MFFRIAHIFQSFTSKERGAFYISTFLFVVSAIFLFVTFFKYATVRVAVSGGTYTEGLVGQPIYINPVLSGTNDADRDLIHLIFSNVYDIAEKVEASKDGKVWTVRVAGGVKWHDGMPLTSDDVIFTIQSILDPEAHSPLRDTFHDVKVSRVSEREITLTIPTPYAFFADNLKNLYVVPRHIFESVPVANWRLSSYNLAPIGSGPYAFDSSVVERSGFISRILLKRSDSYAKEKPLIDAVALVFFKSEDELISSFNTAQIDGFLLSSPDKLSSVYRGHQVFKLPTSLSYAVFFNESANTALKDSNVRLAMNRAVDRDALIDQVFGGNGFPVYGPLGRLLPTAGTSTPAQSTSTPDSASQVLDRGGWVLGEDGVRRKSNLKLEFQLAVPEYDALVDAAHFLEDSYKKVGIKLNIQVLPSEDINRDLIRSRNYELMLFGNSLLSPDLFSFWHSSERFYPGLNLALYQNSATDRLIESIRKNFDIESRNKDLVSLNSLIAQNLPAIFLYSPDYVYVAATNFGGIEDGLLVTPSDRFNGITNWHVKSALNIK